MEGRRTACYCDMPVVVKTIWAGSNAGRRFERCATRECHYDIWIDEPLGTRACEAIEELVREKNQLHRFYMQKINRLRALEMTKRGTMLAKLQELKDEVVREDFKDEDAPVA